MGLDRRIRYTKKVIKDSFLKLLYEYSIDDVTIKAICIDADINRATFYRHYENIYDLLEKIEAELSEEIAFNSVKDLIDIRVLTIIYNNQGFYREFLRTNLVSNRVKNTESYLSEVEKEKSNCRDGHDARGIKISLDYFIYGMVGLLKDWVENGCIETPEEYAKVLEEVTSY